MKTSKVPKQKTARSKVKSTLKQQPNKENVHQGRSYSSIMVKSDEWLEPRKSRANPTLTTG